MTKFRKEIDEGLLYDLLQTGAPRKDVAQYLGISSQTLSHRIADIQTKQGLLLQYRSIQALQLTEMQARILEAITPDKIEEAPLKDLVLCYKVLKDKELVVDGKPSEIKGLVSYLVHMEREQIACEAQLGQPSISCDDAEVSYSESLEEDVEVMPNL